MARASELFEERGFDRTTVDQIAEATEISRRTFFRYLAEDERLLGVLTTPLTRRPPASTSSTWPCKPGAWPRRSAGSRPSRPRRAGLDRLEALPAPKLALAGSLSGWLRASGGMGRAPNWRAPRHLAAARRSRTDAREHVAAEWVLAAVAIVLTAAVVIGQMLGSPGPPEDDQAATGPPGTRPPAAAPTTATGPPSTAGGPARAGNPIADPGFEAGLAGWLAVGGARVARTRVGQGQALGGRLHRHRLRRPGHGPCRGAPVHPGQDLCASLWIRASLPDTLVQVTLLEVAGGRRLAADSVGAVLQDQEWRRVEVAHDAHRHGASLAVEVVLPRGSPRAAVMVDDLEVRSRPGPKVPGG